MHWRAQCHARRPRGGTEFQHLVGIETMSPERWDLSHEFVSTRIYRKIRYMTRHISQSWPIFWVQDRHCRTAQFEYQGQTRYTRILDRNFFLYTYWRIGHRFPSPSPSPSLCWSFFYWPSISLMALVAIKLSKTVLGHSIPLAAPPRQLVLSSHCCSKKSNLKINSKSILKLIIWTCWIPLFFRETYICLVI